MKRLKLVIADDEAMVRRGLRMLIETEPGLDVVGEAANGREAVSLARRTRPDLVLMDVRMPELDGLSAARQVLALPHPPRVLMLTTFDEDENVYEALRIGTSGFLLKASPPEQLLEAIRAVGSGNALIDPAVTKRVIDAFKHQPRSGPPPPASTSSRHANSRSCGSWRADSTTPRSPQNSSSATPPSRPTSTGC